MARASDNGRVHTPANPPGLRDLPFELPGKTPGEKRRARAIYRDLERRYPDAHCELDYARPHELLIATILSAQSTDVGVNKATPALFERFATPEDFAGASPEEIEPYVRSLGFFRNKSRAVHEAMRSVVEDFGGEVPRTMEGLLSLRGVARKTANVVLGNAFGINDGVPVDTHVQRLSRLYGLAPEDAKPPAIEKHLMALFPRDTWCMVSHLLIWHGRRCSTARTKPEDDPVYVKHCRARPVPARRAKKKTQRKKPGTTRSSGAGAASSGGTAKKAGASKRPGRTTAKRSRKRGAR